MSLDTVATVALAVVTLSAVWGICRTEPGAALAWLTRRQRAAAYHRTARARHSAVWLDAHHVPATARCGPYDGDRPAICAPAGDTGPFPAVTITPEIREFARTS